MTQTLEPDAATDTGTVAGSPTDSRQPAAAWLAALDAALQARDVPAAVELFGTQSFWRDLVSLTWNITTAEGKDGIADLLEATLDTAQPNALTFTEPVTEAEGVVEGGSLSRRPSAGAKDTCD